MEWFKSGAPYLRLYNRIKQNELWWYSIWLMVSARIGDVVNLYVSIFIVPDKMDASDIGAILPLTRIINVIAVPITVAAAVFLRFSTKFEAAGQPTRTNKLMRDFLGFGFCLGGLVLLVFALVSGVIGRVYEVSDIRVVWIIGLLGFIACVTPPLQTATQALERYRMFVAGNVLGPLSRLLLAIFLIGPLQIVGLFLANTSASLVRAGLLARDAWPFIRGRDATSGYGEFKGEMLKFALPFGLYTFLVAAQFFGEASLIRTALGEEDSAGFFMISTLGSAPMFLLAALTPLLLPVLSHRHERKQGSRKTHVLMLGCALVLGLGITLFLFLVGPHLFSWKASWHQFIPYGPYLWLLALTFCLSGVDYIHRTNLHAKSSFRYLSYFAPILIAELLLLVFVSLKPEILQDAFGEHNFVGTLCMMLSVRILVCVGMVWDLWRPGREASENVGTPAASQP